MADRLPRTGDTVAGCLLEERLGRGSTGTVFRARGPGSTPVAVKLVGGPQGLDERSLRRFERERTSLQAVRHPNVIRVLAAGVHCRHGYLVTELLQGHTLAERVRSGPLVREELALAGQQLLAAVGAIHQAGILHRDLTPTNVFLQPGRLVILDFGLARLVGEPTLTRSRSVLMTISYAPPERFRGEALSPAADIYVAALLLFEMATGRRPFARRQANRIAAAHLMESPPSACDRNPRLPRLLDRVLDRGLRKDPSDRYPDAASFEADWCFVTGAPEDPAR
jgi:serine/threonine-protein kinase